MIRLFTLSALFVVLMLSTAQAQSSGAAAKGNSRDSVPAQGATKLKMEFRTGQVDIVANKKNKIEAVLKDGSGRNVMIVVSHGVARILVDGDDDVDSVGMHISVPSKSSIDIETVDGLITIIDVGGDVDVEAVSGTVHVKGANELNAESVSADIVAEETVGPISMATISGDLKVLGRKTVSRVELESVSGRIEFNGLCAAKCRLEAASLSGDIHLNLDKKRSAFEMEFESFTGKLTDELGLKITSTQGSAGRGVAYVAHFGKAGPRGEIECETHSGSLTFSKK